MVPRLVHLHPSTHRKLIRLKKEAEREGEYRVAKRLHAVILNSEGQTSGNVSAILKAPRSKVSEWLRNFDAYGVEGILEGYRTGRPTYLTEAQHTCLGDIVESGPVAYGFDSGVWTSPMIARVIQEEFEVSYHPGHVRKLLKEIGFSVQRPRRVLRRANPKEQDRWHRYTFPSLKKKRQRPVAR
jgi:transposase